MTDHNLRLNGAAHNDLGELIDPENPKSTAGEGRGKCSCGRLSDVLPNGASRRRWHKWHKETEAAAATEEQPVQEETAMPETPAVEESVTETVEETQETDAALAEASPEQDLMEDLIGDVEPEPVKQEEFHKGFPFTDSLAKHFWAPLAVKGTREFLARNFPEIKESHDNARHRVRLTGHDKKQVHEAAVAVSEMWEAAAVEFRDWKKTNADYASLDHTSRDDRSKSYILTRDFFVNFGKSYEY